MTPLYRTLQIYLDQYRATCEFSFDDISEIPNVGELAEWVTMLNGATIGGSEWYISDRALVPSQVNTVRLTARIPGIDWTWIDLRPILHPGETYLLAFYSQFSNYDSENDTVVTGTQYALELEWLDTEQRNEWLHKANGQWPTGWDDIVPVDGTQVYRCHDVEVRPEFVMDALTGESQIYYRHFATLRQAPATDAGKQLIWSSEEWSL